MPSRATLHQEPIIAICRDHAWNEINLIKTFITVGNRTDRCRGHPQREARLPINGGRRDFQKSSLSNRWTSN
jgi:hypothetical protein